MRLLQIDESNREDHARLLADDTCYHIYEYTSGKGYGFSATNSLINNLKKKPTAPAGQLYYKDIAIQQCSAAFRGVLPAGWLGKATLVPVPPSKAKDDPDYDRRMERVARGIRPGLDVRNLVVQTASTAAAHEVGPGERVTVEDLLELYEIDETLTGNAPQVIGILDDVLTAGTHFRAMKTVLSQRFPEVRIVGLFVARRVFANPFETDD